MKVFHEDFSDLMVEDESGQEFVILPPGDYETISARNQTYRFCEYPEECQDKTDLMHIPKCTIGKVVRYSFTEKWVEFTSHPKPEPKAGPILLISPDGFTITGDEETCTAATILDALWKIKAWVDSYARQGYYSHARYGRMGLNSLLMDTIQSAQIPDYSENQ